MAVEFLRVNAAIRNLIREVKNRQIQSVLPTGERGCRQRRAGRPRLLRLRISGRAAAARDL